jgi:hypothetical protein
MVCSAVNFFPRGDLDLPQLRPRPDPAPKVVSFMGRQVNLGPRKPRDHD